MQVYCFSSSLHARASELSKTLFSRRALKTLSLLVFNYLVSFLNAAASTLRDKLSTVASQRKGIPLSRGHLHTLRVFCLAARELSQKRTLYDSLYLGVAAECQSDCRRLWAPPGNAVPENMLREVLPPRRAFVSFALLRARSELHEWVPEWRIARTGMSNELAEVKFGSRRRLRRCNRLRSLVRAERHSAVLTILRLTRRECEALARHGAGEPRVRRGSRKRLE